MVLAPRATTSSCQWIPVWYGHKNKSTAAKRFGLSWYSFVYLFTKALKWLSISVSVSIRNVDPKMKVGAC